MIEVSGLCTAFILNTERSAVIPVVPDARLTVALLVRFNIHGRLWPLPPGTFSGRGLQRVNIARRLAHPCPARTPDSPAAISGARNRSVVLALIAEARARSATILGIFHDRDACAQVCDQKVDVAAPGGVAA